MATTITSYPIDFDLYDEEQQQVLFITDDVAGQYLTLEITNTSDKPISPKSLSGSASSLNYHFELVFRPGTLYNVQPAISLVNDNFELFMEKENGTIKANPDGTLSLFLYSKGTWTLQEGKKLLIRLNQMRAEATDGTRGTRVLLRYQNLLHAGDNEAFSGFREMYLNIVNHRGKKNIPLTVGFVGSNRVLNDGKSPNKLTLRITNSSRKDISLETSVGSKLIVSMESGSPDQEWTIATDGQMEGIGVSYSYPENLGLTPIEAKTTGAWEIPFVKLDKGQFIDIQITKLVTAHPAGYASLFLHYENIPGYWDDQFVAIVEKGPLTFDDKKVGIGTKPDAILHVVNISQDANVDTLILGPTDSTNLRLGYHNDYSWIQSHGLKPLKINPIGNTVTINAETLTVKDGKVGIGTQPDAVLHVINTKQDANGNTLILGPTDSTNLRLGYHTDYSWIQSHGGKPLAINPLGNDVTINAGALTIKDGKVGIGTSNPISAKLTVSGTSGAEGLDLSSTDQYANLRVLRNSLGQQDKDMYMGYQSGPNSSLHLYSNNNETVTVKDSKVGINITNPNFSLDVKGAIGLRNDAAWDHLFLQHDGGTGYINAGGADNGLAFRVGNGASGGYGGQNYNEIVRLMPDGRVKINGRLGINNDNPGYPLRVSGFNDYDLGGGFYFMFRDECRQARDGSHINSISIKADNGIESSQGLYCTSDLRIKTEIQPFEQSTALELLKKLEVVDYHYKDFVTLGTRRKKGFIAQDIEVLFPEAVAKSTDFIPSIYNIPESTSIEAGSLLVTMKEAHNLVSRDIVRLITKENNTLEITIQVLDETTFSVPSWTGDAEHLFVYGKQVHDFMTLDYDYVFCAAISATQALSKQVNELETRLKALEESGSQTKKTLIVPVAN